MLESARAEPPLAAGDPPSAFDVRTWLSYGLSGFWFSIWIPIAAWVLVAMEMDSRQFINSIADLHAQNPVVWLFDLAPFLGAFFAIWLRLRMDNLRRDLSGVQHELEVRQRNHEAAHAKIQARNQEMERLTELHQAAARRFEELFQGLPVACFTYDQTGTIYECNRELENRWGSEAYQFHLQNAADTVMAGANKREWAEITGKVFRGEAVSQVEMEIDLGGRGKGWFLCSSFPLRATDESIVGAISALVEITQRKDMERTLAQRNDELHETAEELQKRSNELEIANAQLATLATTDGLTGVANRRLFRERLDVECELASDEEPLSLILLDVDHFKQFNDSFGHQAGDDLLKRLASRLKELVRAHDVVARYGGEEFVILLPNAGLEVATQIAERLCKRIEAENFAHRTVTISIGVASKDSGPLEARMLLERADEALYVSKRAGRNRFTLWSPNLSESTDNAA